MNHRLSRRGFLLASGAASITILAGCGGGDSFAPMSAAVDQTKMWRLSTREVSSASNAAKAHAASKRFVSPAAAEAGRAHPGDKSRIVPLDISPTIWEQYFGSGAVMVDLRSL